TWLHPDRIAQADENYTPRLRPFSHEYFHAWNVKPIKPTACVPYNLDKENYTEQLWAFEGITSYYDDVFLARSRTISPESYLKLLAQGITRVQQTRGRLRQTWAESSRTAWNKFYKPDENSPNAIVSYYQKGALAELFLDLKIRKRSNGSHSLDTVM
ncbi:M61 family metallopeptidase, partial [Neisseria cinerea]